MSDIFSGLESMGLVGLSSVNIYEEEKTEEKTDKPSVIIPEIKETDYIFDKKVKCPMCDKEFLTKTVKTGKAKSMGADSDLRPKYANFDPIKYDAIACPHCGYASLSRFYGPLSSVQIKLIKEQVAAKFSKLPETGEIYSYDDALGRYKLALLNSIVKKSKVSERAYTCLKTAWLYRGKRENMKGDTDTANALKADCLNKEKEMLLNAYEGFVVSREKENFPICGMDEYTFDYLLADLAARLQKYDMAVNFASNVILSRTAPSRIKEKARDLRDSIKNKVNK